MRDELFVINCDQCQDQFDAELQASREQERQEKLQLRWHSTLARFNVRSLHNEQHWWVTKLGPEIKAAASHWIDQHARTLSIGLGLIGVSGIGKTIASAHCARAALQHGHSIAITSDPRLSTMAIEMANHDPLGTAARAEYRDLLTANLLILDDIGQSCTSGPARALLLKLVNERTLAGGRILWTCQGGGNWIAMRLGCPPDPDKPGKYLPTEELQAFLRRLAPPFCRVTTITTTP